jgi:acyl carrier protein
MQLMDIKVWILASALLMGAGMAHAAEDADTPADADTIAVYKRAMESAEYFDTAYGYAVFPTVAETMADALGCDVADIKLDVSLIEGLDAESIDFLDMVFRLERAFKIGIFDPALGGWCRSMRSYMAVKAAFCFLDSGWVT